MAIGTPTITFTHSRPKRVAPGLKILNGRIGLSANSHFAASAIERRFRRCDTINVDVLTGTDYSAKVVYDRSTTRNNGVLRVHAISAASEILCAFHGYALLGLSGHWVATGT